MGLLHELKPVYDKNSKVLILGSFPSQKSRELGFYYMHPSNRFWRVLEKIFHEEVDDKKAFCLQHGIALFDTVASCDITSSSDSSIKNIVPNDLSKILKEANIKAIFTTGQKAHQIYEKYLYPMYQIKDICLSSTSLANAKKSFDELVEEYKIILEFLKDK